MARTAWWNLKNITPLFAIIMGLSQIVPNLFSFELTNYEKKYLVISGCIYLFFLIFKSKFIYSYLIKGNLTELKIASPLSDGFAITFAIILIMCLSYMFKLEISRIYLGTISMISILFAIVDKMNVSKKSILS
jgi:hypothetical protein